MAPDAETDINAVMDEFPFTLTPTFPYADTGFKIELDAMPETFNPTKPADETVPD